jgi:hypothetical protein
MAYLGVVAGGLSAWAAHLYVKVRGSLAQHVAPELPTILPPVKMERRAASSG